jgi:hypothetical protein
MWILCAGGAGCARPCDPKRADPRKKSSPPATGLAILNRYPSQIGYLNGILKYFQKIPPSLQGGRCWASNGAANQTPYLTAPCHFSEHFASLFAHMQSAVAVSPSTLSTCPRRCSHVIKHVQCELVPSLLLYAIGMHCTTTSPNTCGCVLQYMAAQWPRSTAHRSASINVQTKAPKTHTPQQE